MAVFIDSVSASQSQASAAPDSVFNIAATAQAMRAQTGTAAGSTLTPADVKAGTLGELAATPEGQSFLKVLTEAVQLNACNDMKRHQQKLKELQKQRRAEAQGG